MMCVSDIQGEECYANEVVNCCYCLLTEWSCVLENQNPVSIEALLSDMVRIGDYELLEKQNEGYNTN